MMEDGGGGFDFDFGGDNEPYPAAAGGEGQQGMMSFVESPVRTAGVEEHKLGDSAARMRPWQAGAGSAKNAVSEVC